MKCYDYLCEKCQKTHKDIIVDHIDQKVSCPDCNNFMIRLFPAPNFKAFPGSYNYDKRRGWQEKRQKNDGWGDDE
jgi:predicted nucleic acid-binding Zn ribbon protein